MATHVLPAPSSEARARLARNASSAAAERIAEIERLVDDGAAWLEDRVLETIETCERLALDLAEQQCPFHTLDHEV